MASSAGPYTGAAGQTRQATTTVWCGGCGAWFGGAWYQSIHAGDSPELLARFLDEGFAGINRLGCVECDWSHVVHEPLAVHHPADSRLRLVIPNGQRHRAQQARAALIVAVAEAPGDGVPRYALEPELMGGPRALRDALQVDAKGPVRKVRLPSPPIAPRPGADPDPTVEADAFSVEIAGESAEVGPPVPSDSVEVLDSGEWTHDRPKSADRSDPPIAVAEVTDSSPPREARPSAPARKGGLLAELLDIKSNEPPPPPVPGEAEADGWDESVDDGWTLGDEPATPEDDPTHVVSLESVAAERRPAGPDFDASKARGDGYVTIENGVVRAAVKCAPARAAAFEEGSCILWFQVHHAPAPVLTLTLVRAEDSQVADHAFWVLEPTIAEHGKVLATLEASFAVDVAFHLPDGKFHGRRRLQAPLEANVRAGRQLVASFRGGGESAAASKVGAADYDRIGQLRHNFARNSFEDLQSCAETRLALGILSYWSTPERRDYLVNIKSFPLVWLGEMNRRVLERSIAFGLAMEPHMRTHAIELGLADNSAGLLRLALANFAEVNLNLKPNGLDPLDIWDNWEHLLALAEELDLRVDEEIEELAAQAMERAREAAQGEPIEIDEDASLEIAEVSELADLSEPDLVSLLEDREQRREAAQILLSRGDAVFVPPLFDAIRKMSRDELLAVVPAALSMGPSFESAFLVGLRSRRVSLQLASALFLAEIRSERAVGPILALLPSAADPVWPALARSAARMGRRIIGPAVEQVEAEDDRGGRVAETLALLGADAKGPLSAAREQAAVAAVKTCLDEALERMTEVSFGDAADFTERLSDAFSNAGPDQLGPDFEEELESIDLGPGASISGLETDVDLDGLDS
jgi:hypothetical protein